MWHLLLMYAAPRVVLMYAARLLSGWRFFIAHIGARLCVGS
jgi:hypothetical protein